MLQPSQLEDVSVRFADEIAEVREFFVTAGIAVGSPQAMAQVTGRLRDDRGFHRDLTSHVWVMLHRRGSAVRYGETLGVLAIAAAGKQHAAQADELVAHQLLRFVMEAHDRLNQPTRLAAVPEAKPVAPVIPMRPAREVAEPPILRPEPVIAATPAVNAEPVAEPQSTEHHASTTSRMLVPSLVRSASVAEEQAEAPVRPPLDPPIRLTRVAAELPEEPERRGRGLLWIALVAVLLLAVAGGWWWKYENPAGDPEATPATAVEGTSATAAEPPRAVVVAPEPPVAEAPVAKSAPAPENAHHARAAEASHAHPQSYKPEIVPSYPQPSLTARSTPPPAASASNTRPGFVGPPVPSSTPAPIVRSSVPSTKSGPNTVPSNTLSNQLDRPGLTKEQEAEYDATGRRYPKLLRRTPANSTQVAANNIPTLPGANASGAASAGVVRTTSLGIMAGNVLYSPAAVYPQAASASHVTGAVKLEAVVDTAGNVVNARIISGPPQLRDAALSAVQQWRYKPYTPGGKARMFTTQALMEFELP